MVTGLIAAHIVIDQQMGFLAWPFGAAATIFSFSAWWLYTEDGTERSLLRASVAAILLSITAFGVTIPQLHGAVSRAADFALSARQQMRG